ncbi:MAG: branched-chain amino acid ABC transporter permease [Acidimicrobiia bacterium]|nr:branched-chain amino acid ABC transporter permease [Acidimicrobiia bacterium]
MSESIQGLWGLVGVVGFSAQEQVEGASGLGQMMVDWLSLGSIYALLAMGFVIIFKSTQVLNFAHGALAALGAFMVAYLANVAEIPGQWMGDAPNWLKWVSSAILAMVAAALIGLILERIFIRPMLGEGLFAVAIVTLGLDIAIRTITNDFIGTNPRPLGIPTGGSSLDLGWAVVPWNVVISVLVTLATVGLIALFFRSRTGVAMQATAFDQEAARAQGIQVGRIFSLAWAMGAAMAAVAGIFVSVSPRRSIGVDPSTAFFAFLAFPAVVLGGLDSVVGAVVGGYVIGLAQAAVTEFVSNNPTFAFLGSGFGGVVPYLVMLLVLLIRPYGLFGTEEIRRV